MLDVFPGHLLSVGVGGPNSFSLQESIIPLKSLIALVPKLRHAFIVLFNNTMLNRLQGIPGSSFPLFFGMFIVESFIFVELGEVLFLHFHSLDELIDFLLCLLGLINQIRPDNTNFVSLGQRSSESVLGYWLFSRSQLSGLAPTLDLTR